MDRKQAKEHKEDDQNGEWWMVDGVIYTMNRVKKWRCVCLTELVE